MNCIFFWLCLAHFPNPKENDKFVQIRENARCPERFTIFLLFFVLLFLACELFAAMEGVPRLGFGWAGEGGNYVRSTQIPCHLRCFLAA